MTTAMTTFLKGAEPRAPHRPLTCRKDGCTARLRWNVYAPYSGKFREECESGHVVKNTDEFDALA